MKVYSRHFDLPCLIIVLAVLLFASVAIGPEVLPLHETISAFTQFDASNTAHLLVRELRVPRTLVTFFCGSALAIAGLITQSMTRNPIAEPGLLGVNAGASLAVIVTIAFFGAETAFVKMLAGAAGAALCSLLVVKLGTGPYRFSQDKLVLAGVAFSAVCLATGQLVIASADLSVFEQYRHWMVGATAGKGFDVLWPLMGCWLVALVLALYIAPGIDVLMLGNHLATALGVNEKWLSRGCLTVITLLAGASTAAAGPILFTGLVVPFLCRCIAPVTHRRQLLLCAVIGGEVLLLADVSGRVVAAPGEVSTGIMMAILGGPVFIALARNVRGATS